MSDASADPVILAIEASQRELSVAVRACGGAVAVERGEGDPRERAGQTRSVPQRGVRSQQHRERDHREHHQTLSDRLPDHAMNSTLDTL
jgi:hypothetical protein